MASDRAFLGTCVLIFTASAAAAIHGCLSMSGMAQMPMPGGWAMSMAWLPMCGQSWLGLAASFISMWTVMMVAMMLPSLIPMLMAYRSALGTACKARIDWLAWVVSAGYFSIWLVLGVVVFPACAAMALAQTWWPAMARAVPIAAGMVVMAAGALQFTAWKARRLACCRCAPCSHHASPARTTTAWRHGLKLGLGCVQCCAGQTAALLVLGAMDLCVMATVTAAITAERLAPAGHRVARGVGAIMVGAGVMLIMHGAWLMVR
jgi:predicted metal-binding membrane protein